MQSRSFYLLACLAATLLLVTSGCGGKSKKSQSSSTPVQSSSASSVTGLTKPNTPVQVMFPPPASSTEKDQILMYGTINQTSNIAKLLVNDVAVEGDLTQWSSTLVLKPGTNVFKITSQNAEGVSRDEQTITVKKTINWLEPKAIALDATQPRLWVLDKLGKRVISVDKTTGERQILSPTPLSTSPNLINLPISMILDAPRNRLILAQSPILKPGDNTEFLTVDLTTGEQKALVSADFTDIYLNHNPTALTLQGDFAYIADLEYVYLDKNGQYLKESDVTADNTSQAIVTGLIYRLNLISGERTVVSNRSRPSTTFENPFVSINSLSFDPINNQLFALNVINSQSQSILKVNLTDGTRTPLSLKDSQGVAITLSKVKALVFNPTTNQLSYIQPNAVGFIPLDTNVPTPLSNPLLPLDGQYRFGVLDSMLLDISAQKYFTLDKGMDLILEVDATTGVRKYVSGNAGDDIKGLLTFQKISALNWNHDFTQILTADRVNDALVGLDIKTGLKTLLNKTDVVINEEINPIVNITSLVWENAKQRLLMMNGIGELIALDPTVSIPKKIGIFVNIGYNNFLSAPGSNELFLGATPGVVKIDPQDIASMTIFSAVSIPNTDVPISKLNAIAFNYSTGQLLGIDSDTNQLIDVNTQTGVRTLVSGPTKPSADGGPSLQIPKSLAAFDNTAVILDTGRKSLLSVNLTTGVRSVLLNYNSDKLGLYNPTALLAHPWNHYLVVVDEETDNLVAIDPTTKQWVTLSR